MKTRMTIRSLRSHSGVVALLLAVAAGAFAQTPADPAKPGPYSVGVVTMVFVDDSRTDPATNGPRTLLTDIWYPAADDAKNLLKNKYSDFLLNYAIPGTKDAVNEAIGGSYGGGVFDVEAYEKVFKNESYRNAEIRDGKFPLLVFSHGNGGTRAGYTFWYDHMASHGYIVVAPDHTGNSRFTFVDGKIVPFNGDLRQYSGENRPKDVSFLLDKMTELSNAEGSQFLGRIDLNAIGVAGMSFGGFTAIHTINTDTRIKAMAALAPVWRERTNYKTPVLMMIGSEDKTIGTRGNDNNRKYYDESKGPHYLVEIKDAGHFTFTNVFQLNPNFGDGIGEGERITKPGEKVTFLSEELSHKITNSYSLAFFSRYLKGETGYDAYLQSNPFGDLIIHKFGGVD